MKNKVRQKGNAKIIDGYTAPSRGVEQAVAEIEKMIKTVSDFFFFPLKSVPT